MQPRPRTLKALTLLIGALALVLTSFAGVSGASETDGSTPADESEAKAGNAEENMAEEGQAQSDSASQGRDGEESPGSSAAVITADGCVVESSKEISYVAFLDGGGAELDKLEDDELDGGETFDFEGYAFPDGTEMVEIKSGTTVETFTLEELDCDETTAGGDEQQNDGQGGDDGTDEDGADDDRSGMPETTVAIECFEGQILVTVTGQDLSNIFLYNTEDGVRGDGGEDTIREYSGGDLPESVELDDDEDTTEYLVDFQEGTVRVSAKAGQTETYENLDCDGTTVGGDEQQDDGGTGGGDDDTGGDEGGTGGDEGGTGGDAPGTDVGGIVDENPTQEQPPVDVENDVVVPVANPVGPVTPVLAPTGPAQDQVMGSDVDRTPVVMGDVVTRSGQLPRTGGDLAAGLAPFGLALLLAGVAIQRSSRRMSTTHR